MWKLFFFLFLLAACSSQQYMDRSEHSFQGTIFTGLMAIGGETTGVILEAKDGNTYELYMKNMGRLKSYHNKKVALKGRFTPAAGTEILNRNLIEVTEITLVE